MWRVVGVRVGLPRHDMEVEGDSAVAEGDPLRFNPCANPLFPCPERDNADSTADDHT